jgi:acyl carrier protein
MGLELVELIMETEKEFGISFRETEIYGADTVGKFVDVVYSRFRKDKREPCPSQHAFYEIRNRLMEAYSTDRSQIRPNTELERLIPRENRRKHWEEFLKNFLDVSVADVPLEATKWLNRIIIFLIPSVVFLLFFSFLPLVLFWVGLFPALLTGWFLDWLLTPFKMEFPKDCSSVKGLVPYIKSFDAKVWSRNEVFEKIREIIVDLIDIHPKMVTSDAHWINDLGMG